MNPKFLTLSENTLLCVPIKTDDGKQRQEDREGVEKRMASVLSSFSLSWLLHIHVSCHLYMTAGRVEGFVHHLVELIFEVGCHV